MYKTLFYRFKKPKAVDLASKATEEYERLLLAHQASAAYHGKMAEYYGEGIQRLAEQYKFGPSPAP